MCECEPEVIIKVEYPIEETELTLDQLLTKFQVMRDKCRLDPDAMRLGIGGSEDSPQFVILATRPETSGEKRDRLACKEARAQISRKHAEIDSLLPDFGG